MADSEPVVAILGGGFAGLACARALKRTRARVVLIDRKNHHLFQPLLYQVATAALSPASIASPIRRIVRRQRNTSVIMAEAESIDAARSRLELSTGPLEYDYLVIACGMTHDYFGNASWAAHAPGLKTVEDALEIRRRILLAFESAEVERDPEARQANLNFVVVGGGPTGVELAGAIAEIATQSIPRDFRNVDTTEANVILVEGADRLLKAFHPKLSARARRDLEQLGVEVVLGDRATRIDGDGVTIGEGEDGRRVPSRCVLWAAGLRAESIVSDLEAPQDGAGRVRVNGDLSVPGHGNIFVVGDLMSYTDPESKEPVPGVAQGAMQSGRFVGELLARETAGQRRGDRPTFHYRDKGSMATIGRARAVAELGSLRFGGLAAWLLWSAVHVAFLVGFRNKASAMFEWAWLYIFWMRGARIITGQRETPDREGRALD